MNVHFNRETKAFCPDSEPIRTPLRDFGAAFVEVGEQADHYYHLRDGGLS